MKIFDELGRLLTVSATDTNALLDGSIHTDTTDSAATKGDLVIGNATPAWDDLAIGDDNQYLKVATDLPAWEALDITDDTAPVLGGDLEYGEKHQIFNTTLTSDNTASGDIITVTFGESVVFGDLVYANGTEDEFMKGLATNAAVKHPVTGVALETKADSESGKMLLRGLIRDATHFSGFAMGDLLFLSDGTAGAWLNAAPTDSGDIVQLLGFVVAANYAFFNPDYTYVEIT